MRLSGVLARLLALSCSMAACGGPSPTPPTAELYAEALATSSLDEGAGSCGRLPSPELRGDCTVALLEAHPEEALGSALCESLEEGRWRDECWFVTAELAQRDDQPEEASRRCALAGGFTRDCTEHLWKIEARERLGAEGHAILSAVALDYERRLLSAEASTASKRAWTRSLRLVLGDSRATRQPTPCEAVTDDVRGACQEAMAELVGSAPGGLSQPRRRSPRTGQP